MVESMRLLEIVLVVALVLLMWSSVSNFAGIKRKLIGQPMPSRALYAAHNRLFWLIALPILSADLYSSVAYGPEAGLAELSSLGRAANWLILPITVSTVLLLFILIISYIMGIIAYPSGGGAYTIAKDNFKSNIPALIASSSLLIDYVLTVAVSISSGIVNMAAAYPALAPYQTLLAVFVVFFLVMFNLRGVAESARILAWPTFFFMASMILIIIVGFIHELRFGFVQPVTPPFGAVPQGLTMMVILRAFSSACSSLTGIETISNAVPIFREPQQKNAIKTYIALGVMTGVTLLGFAYHLYVQGIRIEPNVTALSQLLEIYFGRGILYQIIIWSTFAVLILAANSTFIGFSQLTAIVAADGFLPRAFTNRGDRLMYSNGIILLGAVASLLIIIFRANVNALIPLYAIGVFLAFTVAQMGLIRRWTRIKGPYWPLKFGVNMIGAVVTALVTVIVAVTKFGGGAWVVLILIPLVILASVAIRRHYDYTADELRINFKTMRPEQHHVLSVVLVSGIHRVVLNTLSFATSLGTDVVAVYVGFNDESIKQMERQWEEWGAPCRLVLLKSEYRSILQPLSKFIRGLEEKEGEADHIHVILPQFIPRARWHNLLHNQSALLLRAWLFRDKDVVITTVPYHLHK